MKKQLLYAFAFFGAMTFASAQSNTDFTLADDDTAETFIFGTNASYALSTGSGFANSATFIAYNNVTSTTITESFKISTTGLVDANATLQFRVRKRPDNAVTGNITVNGESQAFNFPANAIALSVDQALDFTTPILIDNATNEIEVFFNIETTTLGTETNVRFRMFDVTVTPTVLLSNDSIDAVTDAVKLQNNPVADSLEFSNPSDIVNVSVFNIGGQLVKSFSNGNYNVSDLAAGVYSVRITTATGSKSIKIIKA